MCRLDYMKPKWTSCLLTNKKKQKTMDFVSADK